MPKIQEDAWVIDQYSVARQTYRMRLQSPGIARLANPGQFFMLQVRDGLDPLLRRPFSFHRIFPEEGVVEILYRVVGRGTYLISQCTPGTRLSLIGPLGNGFEIPRQPVGPIFLVAGGIGIAPLLELIVRLAANAETQARGLHLFYGAHAAEELLPAETFTGLNVTVHWSTDDGSLGYHGYVPRLIEEFAEREGVLPSALFACGPLAMQYHVARWALRHEVASQLSLESLMACGVGACLGCALPAHHPDGSTADHYVHVCKDGPIFPAGTIQWQKIQMQQIAPPTFLCI